jgi:putative ABC transport system permease protein
MMLKIIYRNLVHKPLNALLSLALLMLSVAIISLLLVAGDQVSKKLDKDLEGIDMVVGAKGSPLQLVLSAVYHVDAPTGNISKKEADKMARNPMVESAIPLAYGDSYKGYRILGTTPAYLDMYGGKLSTGKIFANPLEVVAGSAVAKRAGLQEGSSFQSTHGEDSRGQVHEDGAYKVVGVLEPTGTVLDQLLLTPVESVWQIHDEAHHDEDSEKPGAPVAHAEGKNHDDHDNEDTAHVAEDKQITAMLIKFRSPMGIMMLPRMINEQSTMQAAVPTLEINRLVNLMGIGISTLQGIALAIMLIAGLSVFVSLYNRLKERKYEHALMRSMGTSRWVIFLLLISEGLLLAVAGFLAGVALCRVGIVLLNKVSAADFHFRFSYGCVSEEWWLFGITLLIGIFASVIPAIKAYRLNIAKTLSDG